MSLADPSWKITLDEISDLDHFWQRDTKRDFDLVLELLPDMAFRGEGLKGPDIMIPWYHGNMILRYCDFVLVYGVVSQEGGGSAF